jgi:hypothetical protein
MRRSELPRYIVGIPAGRICYQGESKITAWLTWALHRKSGAVAFDCASWVSNPSYWLTGDVPQAGFFEVPPAISLRSSSLSSWEGHVMKGRLIDKRREYRLGRYVNDPSSLILEKGNCSQWKWFQLAPPAHKQNGFRWALRRFFLRRFIKSGGILIVVGKTRSGKTLLLEKLMPGNIIENVRPNGFKKNARINASDIPSGIFAIDETPYHDRDDVLRVLEDTALTGRGLALVFQWHDLFRKYDLASCLAKRKVLFLEFENEYPRIY